MNKRNLFVRITAIVLCALMVLSVVTVALYAFAAEPSVVSSPDTGSESMLWVIIAAVAAVAVIIGCLALPKMKKK